MKNFGEFFRPYINISGLPPAVCGGLISTLRIDAKNRMMTARVAFPSLVERRVLYEVENSIVSCKKLRLSQAFVRPAFPKDCFSLEYFPSLVMELKRREACVNGSLKDACARLESGGLVVTLAHGGGEILLARHVDRLLSRLIEEEFGVGYPVRFDGTVTVDRENPVYIEKVQKREETLRREAVMEEVERHETALGKDKPGKTVSIRSGETLMPVILPETARELYGRIPKSKPIPIERITPDIGSVTVWGEIFSLEKKETRDRQRKIYSVNITDYTSSITLKIIEMVQQCKALDTLAKGMSVLVRGDVEYDKYDHEIVLRPKNIARVEQVKVVDDAEEKRVELHLHTNMSSMDGMNSAADMIGRAAGWGRAPSPLPTTASRRRFRTR